MSAHTTLKDERAIQAIVNAFANRSDAANHRLIMELLKNNIGLDMFGAVIQDQTVQGAHPDYNPDTIYASPYPRPTAGAAVLPCYQNADGEIFLLLARNRVRTKDGTITKHPQSYWQLAGGYMDNAPPRHMADNAAYDKSPKITAAREMKEETNLNAADATLTFLYGDTFLRPWGQHISANYLADFGICAHPPKATAGDDVHEVAWVNIKDIRKNEPAEGVPPYNVTINAKQWDIWTAHHPMLEQTVEHIRRKLHPLYEASLFDGLSQFDDKAHEIAQSLPLAHDRLDTWARRIEKLNEHALDQARQRQSGR